MTKLDQARFVKEIARPNMVFHLDNIVEDHALPFRLLRLDNKAVSWAR